MLKAIIFDADNTLYKVNKERAYSEMFGVLEKETKIKAKELEARWKLISKEIMKSCGAKSLEFRRENTLKIALEQLGIKEKSRSERLTKAALDVFWKCIIEDLGFDGTEKETMAQLKKNYTLCISSDEFLPHLEAKLNIVFGDWKKYFKFIISAEDVGEHKPSEKYGGLAIRRLKIKASEAILVGDSWERDIEPAKKQGIRTILIADKKEGAPDLYITQLSDLANVLNSIKG